MEHPKDVGDRSTLAIVYGLRSIGHEVLVPFGENTRYDLKTPDTTWRSTTVLDWHESSARQDGCARDRSSQDGERLRSSSEPAHH
jgi:hypothetical protein